MEHIISCNQAEKGLYLRFIHFQVLKNREVFLVEVCAFASRLSI
jgi:hypothetical protein